MNQQDLNSRIIIGVLVSLVIWAVSTQTNRFTSEDGTRVETRIQSLEERMDELERMHPREQDMHPAE